jgi:LacI family transcriptional regulator
LQQPATIYFNSEVKIISKRPTMKDIAIRVGLSIKTVSLALKSHPSIPEVTRSKIRKIAKAIGYRPDPFLSALNAYRQQNAPHSFCGVLAWIYDSRTRLGWHNSMNDIYQGASERAQELGYKLEHFWLNEPGLTSSRASTILRTRNIQGLIMCASDLTGIALQWEYFSIVTLGHTFTRPELNCINTDCFYTIRTVLGKVRDLGYKRVGLALDPYVDELSNFLFSAGFNTEQKLFKEKIPSLLKRNITKEDLLQWVKKYKAQVVIAVEHSYFQWLRSAGIRFPQEMGFVHITTSPEQGTSGMLRNRVEIGRAATEIVVGMMHRNEKGIPEYPQQILIKSKWYKGKTLRHLISK